MIIFEATMRMVREGTFIGTPISPNDQVLRAECNCGASRPSPSRVLLYDRTFFPLSESSFSALSAGSRTRIPALDCTTRTLDSSATASITFTLSANNRFEN
ncbi:hypothetical protein WR25_17165 [Diploscapter pachys]|uniref:Uncharacterized protein n=1 Tax=Diploscapter pachys TaxID=2018661 RepID=A0A2A2LDC5_9BILA|nr:hypothetical protein WR25_17165 [Diploscapter pachys]